MSTLTSETRNEIDDEPEEGEIQDDEGSLEDVSSDDEISSHSKRKERLVYTQTLVSLRGQFVKTERRRVRQDPRLRSSERPDSSLKKSQTRSNPTCRGPGVLDNYYESVQWHKSSKDHSYKVSGKIHEKENKVKDSKKTFRKSMSFHGSGNEPRNAYPSSECTESYLSSPTSSKGSWRKGDVKDKHKKKKKNGKSNKFSNPLGEVCTSQVRSRRESPSEEDCVKSGVDINNEHAGLQKTAEMKKAEKGKTPLSSPSSPSSDIQILEVPIVIPEIITICDSDDENVTLRNEKNNCDSNVTSAEEGDFCVTTESGISPMEIVEKDDIEDPEENLKLLREAALKSSKPEVTSNVNRDDEVLQLRLEALRSAIIRKFEERKKRGITVTKKIKKGGDKQMMSISPLGSPNYYSSADSTVRACDEIDGDFSSPTEFGVSSKEHEFSDPVNDSEVDKISAIDMELADSDEEREHMCGEDTDSQEKFECESGHSEMKYHSPYETLTDDGFHLVHPVEELLSSVMPPDSDPSATQASVSAINTPTGYIIGEGNDHQSVFESETQENLLPSEISSFDCHADAIQNNGEQRISFHGETQMHSSDKGLPNASICKEDQTQINENVVSKDNDSKSSQSLGTGSHKNSRVRNEERLDAMSCRSDCGFLSPESGELDLNSMIVLDEVGKCSDDAISESSVDEEVNSVKSRNSLYEDTQDTSENSGHENVAELFGKKECKSPSSLHCNAGSLDKNVSSCSDNTEACEENIQTSNENRGINLCTNTTNSTSSSSVKVRVHPENSETEDDVPQVSNTALDTSYGSDVSSLGNVDEASNVQVLCRGDTVASNGSSSSSLSNSQNKTERIDIEFNTETVGSTGVPDKLQTTLKFSSEENDGSSGSLADVEEEVDTKSIQQPVLSPDCEERTVCLPHDSRHVTEAVKSGNDFESSANELLQICPLVANNSSNVKKGDYNQDSITEDDETVLRVNLLAMLEKKPEKQNDKLATETDHSTDCQDVASLCVSSMNKLDSTLKRLENVLPLNSKSASRSSKIRSDIVHKSTEKNSHSSVKETCLTSSPKNHQLSSIQSLPTSVHTTGHSPSLIKRGAKRNKLRVKVPGRFNVNVPKLVINLGDDSDSGDDAESGPVEAVPVSKVNGNDASEESRDNVSGSQSVPPDFAKKLDLLLKQARFQQETHTKDDKGVSSENTDLLTLNLNKVMQLPSTSLNANLGKSSKILSVASSSSTTQTKSVSKVSPLTLHSCSNQHGKNSILNRDKSTFNSININLTKTSTSNVIDANKKDIHGRIKSTSSLTNPSSSVSSVVDIRLLPSSKQKEYIRLKRKLALLARLEQAKKSKENMTIMGTTGLPVRKSGTEEAKGPVNLDVRNSAVRASGGICTERSPFTRKYVKRGQGGNLISRADLKSKRISRTISSFNSQTPLRNRLTVTTQNKISGPAVDGPLIVRRVSCAPQKRYITDFNYVKKLSSNVQITTLNSGASAGDNQKKLASLVNKLQAVPANKSSVFVAQEKRKSKTDNKETETRENIVESENDNEICIQQRVLKRRDLPHPNQESLLGKFVTGEETNSNKIEACSRNKDGSDEVSVNDEKAHTVKRKRCLSEDNKASVRKRTATQESARQQSDFTIETISKDLTNLNIVDRTLAESLWKSESKLISKRYQVLEDIASVYSNLHEIERVNQLKQQLIRNIQKMKEEMRNAEKQLIKKDKLLETLYSDVENAERDIKRKQSETLVLSVECVEVGGKIHGSNYSVPNTCTDLIRHGLFTITNTLEQLKDGRSTVEFEDETSQSVCDAAPVNTRECPDDVDPVNNEDKSKQIQGSYSSPLEAMKKAHEPSKDNQAVLCPYHIMGSCKDKECSYLH